ncbi:786_t:CDS:2 [Funneliformis mosseae]|uniref:786_t:CDS:1 n=1 Tax=Funneliformis mosseae TaxID=27381 RepID=A0A9N9G567_FUNMO|nr:786_t:CDS:2 [Funneliformis mosseae]
MLILKGDDQNTSIPEGDNQSMSILEENTLEESEFESEINTDYSNKAYGDLMALVINYKLNPLPQVERPKKLSPKKRHYLDQLILIKNSQHILSLQIF